MKALHGPEIAFIFPKLGKTRWPPSLWVETHLKTPWEAVVLVRCNLHHDTVFLHLSISGHLIWLSLINDIILLDVICPYQEAILNLSINGVKGGKWNIHLIGPWRPDFTKGYQGDNVFVWSVCPFFFLSLEVLLTGKKWTGYPARILFCLSPHFFYLPWGCTCRITKILVVFTMKMPTLSWIWASICY